MAILDIARQPLINNGALAERTLADIERRDAMRGGFSNLGGMSPDYPYYAGGGVNNYMQGIVSSCVCDVDATIAASYGGSGQTWANLIPSPADGAAQTDYDFWLGETSSATTDDPTFNGSAGSAAAYFSLDGGDHFTIKNMANCPTFLKAHRTDTSGTWCAIAFSTTSITSAGALWGCSWVATALGVYGYVTGAAGVTFNTRHYQTDNTSAINTLISTGSDDTTHHVIIMSWDGTTNNSLRGWIDSSTKITTTQTWKTTTTDSDEIWRIGAGSSGGTATGRMASGTKIYAFSAGNGYIDDSDAAAIYAEYETRHSRDYIP